MTSQHDEYYTQATFLQGFLAGKRGSEQFFLAELPLANTQGSAMKDLKVPQWEIFGLWIFFINKSYLDLQLWDLREKKNILNFDADIRHFVS